MDGHSSRRYGPGYVIPFALFAANVSRVNGNRLNKMVYEWASRLLHETICIGRILGFLLLIVTLFFVVVAAPATAAVVYDYSVGGILGGPVDGSLSGQINVNPNSSDQISFAVSGGGVGYETVYGFTGSSFLIGGVPFNLSGTQYYMQGDVGFVLTSASYRAGQINTLEFWLNLSDLQQLSSGAVIPLLDVIGSYDLTIPGALSTDVFPVAGVGGATLSGETPLPTTPLPSSWLLMLPVLLGGMAYLGIARGNRFCAPWSALMRLLSVISIASQPQVRT